AVPGSARTERRGGGGPGVGGEGWAGGRDEGDARPRGGRPASERPVRLGGWSGRLVTPRDRQPATSCAHRLREPGLQRLAGDPRSRRPRPVRVRSGRGRSPRIRPGSTDLRTALPAVGPELGAVAARRPRVGGTGAAPRGRP